MNLAQIVPRLQPIFEGLGDHVMHLARKLRQRATTGYLCRKISLHKGIPYLLQAMEICGNLCRLTLVGPLEPGLEPLIRCSDGLCKRLPPRSKAALRELYRKHDILVLPSLGDSFGFVAMEAMACSLPVIVTENCGVPVPEESWRVPVMDAKGIAARLEMYARNRDLLFADGKKALAFARRFTPEEYRTRIKSLFSQVLNLYHIYD